VLEKLEGWIRKYKDKYVKMSTEGDKTIFRIYYLKEAKEFAQEVEKKARKYLGKKEIKMV
jgi:hypothetical protein